MVEHSLSSTILSKKRLPEKCRVQRMVEKERELNRLLDSYSVFEINGRSGTGKNYIYRRYFVLGESG